MKFILASKSPRRKELLSKININFDVIDSKIDESLISTNMEASHYCMLLAKLKASNVSQYYSECTVIGADTIVVLNDRILNKPKNFNEAKDMLLSLSNKTHQVITGVAIRNQALNINRKFHETTDVTFYKLDNETLNYYISKYEPYDKSGSYGIQDYASVFVKKINGSYDNVIGFPLSRFFNIIKEYI